MTNELPIQGPTRTGPVRPGAQPAAQPGTGEGGVAFRALLDELEAKARELQQKSQALQGPADLAGAVQGAKASLDDALSIRDRLLEAYREARQQDGAPREPEPKV